MVWSDDAVDPQVHTYGDWSGAGRSDGLHQLCPPLRRTRLGTYVPASVRLSSTHPLCWRTHMRTHPTTSKPAPLLTPPHPSPWLIIPPSSSAMALNSSSR